MRRLVLSTALLAALAGLGALGCSGNGSQQAGGGKRVIFLTNGTSPFWDAARAGMNDADKEFKLKEAGLRPVFETNDGTDRGQIDKLRQFGSQGDIAGIAISVNTAGNVAIVEEMRSLQNKGIKVVTVDSDVDRGQHRDARFAFIGTDNLVGGRELGKCLKGLLPGGGKYVTFVGITGAQNAVERVTGVAEGAGDKIKSLDNMGDTNDRTRARENVRNALNNHPDLSALVGIWSYNAPAIVDVVREKNVRDKVKVVVFDAEPATIEETGKGMVDVMVVQNPYEMGKQSTRLLKALVTDDKKTVEEMLPDHGTKPEGDLYDTGLKVVVPDEGSPLKAEMFDKKTNFLKLSPFRDWLKKYNLTQS